MALEQMIEQQWVIRECPLQHWSIRIFACSRGLVRQAKPGGTTMLSSLQGAGAFFLFEKIKE